MAAPISEPDSIKVGGLDTQSANQVLQTHAFGAKEAGEGSLAAFLPALTNAIADAIGIGLNDLPVTPDRVFEAIEKRKRAAEKKGGGK